MMHWFRQLQRMRSGAGERTERGATVLEWALIAAAVVVAASIISAAIFNIVNSKADRLSECSNGDVTAQC